MADPMKKLEHKKKQHLQNNNKFKWVFAYTKQKHKKKHQNTAGPTAARSESGEYVSNLRIDWDDATNPIKGAIRTETTTKNLHTHTSIH